MEGFRSAGTPFGVAELGQVWTPYSNNMQALFNGEINAEQAAENIKKQVEEGISLMNSGK